MRQDSGLREYDPRSGTPVPEIDEIENMKQNSKAWIIPVGGVSSAPGGVYPDSTMI